MTVEQEIKIQASYAYDDGFSNGVSQGISQGISQGAHDKAVETARSAVDLGLSVQQIMTLTGLPLEEIEQLAGSKMTAR